MSVEKISVNEINEKLLKLKKEHAKFDRLSDTLAKKSYFTPQDEIELKTLRKKKLQKKDMISYYENLLKSNS
jgi:hypothetical protein